MTDKQQSLVAFAIISAVALFLLFSHRLGRRAKPVETPTVTLHERSK